MFGQLGMQIRKDQARGGEEKVGGVANANGVRDSPPLGLQNPPLPQRVMAPLPPPTPKPAATPRPQTPTPPPHHQVALRVGALRVMLGKEKVRGVGLARQYGKL